MAGDYYACVQRILNHLHPGILNDFSSLTSDHKRIKFVQSLEFVQDAFCIQMAISDKSITEAKKWRDKGNAAYQRKSYQEALELYTKCILYAPGTRSSCPSITLDDEELAMGFSNRSAVFYQLGKFDLALQDVELSLHHGYPVDLRYKLCDRQARCLMKLNRIDEAIVVMGNAKKYLDHSRLDKSRRLRVMASMNKSIDVNKSDGKVENGPACVGHTAAFLQRRAGDKWVYPDLPSPRRPLSCKFRGCSDAFDVQQSDSQGRYATAKYPVKVADVIVAEGPYVSVLSRDFVLTHCYNCFKKLDTTISCFKCMTARYCSATCRNQSWDNYHELECPFLKIILNSGIGNMGHLGLRVILEAGLKTLMSRRSGSRTNGKVLTMQNGTYIGGYEALLDLVGHSALRSPNEMFQYTILAVYLLKILSVGGFFDDDQLEGRQAETVELYVGGILLRFLQIITCNGIEIMETHYKENIQRAEQTSMGLALYPTISMINHSCNPTMELIFYKNACVARAIRNISSGQELTIDYGYVYYSCKFEHRQFALRHQYYFDCVCECCRFQWGLREQLPSGLPSIKCNKCGYQLPMRGDDATDPNQVKCRRCGADHTPLSYFEEYYESSRLFDKALDEIRRGNIDGPTKILENHLTLMERYFFLPIKDYVNCLSTLKQCYRAMGNRHIKA